MKNAPLVEIIAELRWAGARSGSPVAITFGGDESLYVKFGIGIGRSGYERLERVLPSGIPVQAGAIVYRYRRADDQQNSLFQLGPGIFTANGLPPYNAWREFEPVIRAGLEELWSVSAFDTSQPIELVLRYLDAFTASLLGPVSRQDFVESVVGVAYRPVDMVTKFSGNSPAHAMRFNVIHKRDEGGEVSLEVGDGEKDGEAALLMTTTATSPQFVAGSPDDVMTRFSELQGILHDMFFEMIRRNDYLQKELVHAAG